MEVVNVLHQLGCFANVEIAWVETPRAFDTLDDAVERFAESVAVGDDPAQRARLRDTLAERLQPAAGGLVFPQSRHPVATVWWDAGALQ